MSNTDKTRGDRAFARSTKCQVQANKSLVIVHLFLYIFGFYLRFYLQGDQELLKEMQNRKSLFPSPHLHFLKGDEFTFFIRRCTFCSWQLSGEQNVSKTKVWFKCCRKRWVFDDLTQRRKVLGAWGFKSFPFLGLSPSSWAWLPFEKSWLNKCKG